MTFGRKVEAPPLTSLEIYASPSRHGHKPEETISKTAEDTGLYDAHFSFVVKVVEEYMWRQEFRSRAKLSSDLSGP